MILKRSAAMPSRSSGSIQLIGSPIGNLGDITYRAVECLKAADVIACEDTRHSNRLLRHLEIGEKELVALHDHNEGRRAQSLANRADAGETIAYLSDAGMPTISDPGYRLVNACVEAGVRVEVIPGPSAVMTALAGSGLPTNSFYFGGFLPVKGRKRSRELESAIERAETSIFFESPHRILKSLDALRALAPDRDICVGRELTKKFETFHRGSAEEISREFEALPAIKGEITLLVAGCGRRRASKS